MGKPIISFTDVVKRYDDETVLKGVSFEIEEGKFYTLLGPSGCGKTTILRIIAGFSEASEGDVYFEGKRINDVPANQRQVNTVFQDYALFPHMNVFENVAFGLKIKKLPKNKIKEKVEEALRLVRLAGYENREISEMSGGQRQRVAIARAIVNEPKVLLLDEPLSALDLKLRTDMQYELRELQQRLGITFIFVTHDQEEALSISDQVCVMFDGVVQQTGTPWVIYNRPANRFVATFVGSNNFLPLSKDAAGRWQILGCAFDAPSALQGAAGEVVASIRPENISVNSSVSPNGLLLDGVVRQSMFTGRELQLTVEVSGYGLLDVLTEPSAAMTALRPGDTVRLGIAPDDLLFFAPGASGELLQ